MAETRPFNAASFDAFLAEHKLMGVRCTSCGALHLPPRALCSNCYGSDLEWIELSGEGQLAAFTAVVVAPTAMVEQGYGRDNPYCAGIVQTAEGPKISARILDVDARQPETIAIGTPLTVDFVDVGEGDDQRTYLAFRA